MRNSTVQLALLLTLVALHPIAAFASEGFPYSEFHFETSAERPTFGAMEFNCIAPNCIAQYWVVYAPLPPELPGQRKPRATLTIPENSQKFKIVSELNRQHRSILSLVIPVNTAKLQHQIDARINYWACLVPRHLVPGAATKTTIPANAGDAYLSPSQTYDFTSPIFQNWLTANQLRRRSGETDMDFAWRTFHTIRRQCTYTHTQKMDRRVSAVCRAKTSDCGSLSYLFISTLRANNIPARALIGRWTSPNDSGDQCHVKSEFFAPGHGWIPIEMSGAVSNKTGNPFNFFGTYNGDFMTFHIDPDIALDSIWFGINKLGHMQFPAYWVRGSGTMTEATQNTVRKVQPIATYD